MRLFLTAFAAFCLLIGCSEAPAPTKAKEPEKPSEPITGRQAFQMTYPQARIWAADCQPLRIHSLNLENPKSEGGKAGAWEIVYVSPSRSRQRSFTWSAIESGSSLHKGVFGGQEDGWSPSRGSQPFLVPALKIDSPEALKTAIEHSSEYLKKGGPKPQITFSCELTTRFPNPVWRVYWGESVSAAEWSVFVDASTGEYRGR